MLPRSHPACHLTVDGTSTTSSLEVSKFDDIDVWIGIQYSISNISSLGSIGENSSVWVSFREREQSARDSRLDTRKEPDSVTKPGFQALPVPHAGSRTNSFPHPTVIMDTGSAGIRPLPNHITAGNRPQCYHRRSLGYLVARFSGRPTVCLP